MRKEKEIIQSYADIISKKKKLYQVFFKLNNSSEITIKHCVDTAYISIIIGRGLGLKESQISELAYAALLHDIGKADVPIEILNSTKSYSTEEFEEMKRHVQYSEQYLKHIPRRIKRAILEHHENYNGSGYPEGKSGREISLYGKILRVADVIDALRTEKPYKKAVGRKEILDYLDSKKGILFDPAVVSATINEFKI